MRRDRLCHTEIDNFDRVVILFVKEHELIMFGRKVEIKCLKLRGAILVLIVSILHSRVSGRNVRYFGRAYA